MCFPAHELHTTAQLAQFWTMGASEGHQRCSARASFANQILLRRLVPHGLAYPILTLVFDYSPTKKVVTLGPPAHLPGHALSATAGSVLLICLSKRGLYVEIPPGS